MKSFLIGIKNVLLWSYERGTWQYDLLCLLVILAVFLVPSKYFGDRDRTGPARANETRMDASKADANYRKIYTNDLKEFLERQNMTELKQFPKVAILLYLQDTLSMEVTLVELKPFNTPNAEAGYEVWFK